MKFQSLFSTAFTFVLLVTLVSLSPNAVTAVPTTESDSCQIARSRLDWRNDATSGSNTIKNCTLDQFNPSVGTLTSITLTAEGKTDTIQRVENKDVSPHTMSSTVTVTLEMQNPSNNNPLVNAAINTPKDSFAAEAFDGDVDFAGASGKTFDLKYAEDSGSATITDPSILALFSGTGSVDFPVRALAEWNCTGSGNAACAVDTFAEASIAVEYTYDSFEPDLSFHSCTDVVVKNNETSIITINGSNGGQADTSGPITHTTELPACLSYEDTTSAGWNCDSETVAGNNFETVTCTYKGTVPAGTFIPELKLNVGAKECAGNQAQYKVSTGTTGESVTQNNSVQCSLAIASTPTVTPSVLGEQTSPTPSPKPTIQAEGEVDGESTDEDGEVLSALANTGIFLGIPVLIAAAFIAIAFMLRRRKEGKEESSVE